jgi:phosphatidate phosphatase APP1
MPELYTFMQRLITQAAPFFYLSASPYNLYAFLHSFRQQYYPQGTMILRDASWRNLSGLLSNLTLGTQEYKVDRMIKINSWIPKRKMICIGDSTQSDPEAYGEMYVPHFCPAPFRWRC